ncbi:UdgX family uracil-DNA binding protein [Roseomonas marmotae]|nr:UdgX family uracil-DNA binding protein [Roseomonas marmotae]
MPESSRSASPADLPVAPWAEGHSFVPGEGPPGAPLMFVGEQPGDEEDRAGRPFVGPAGRLFDQALAEAGVTRAQAYVTNAVKHFKFTQTGRRRLHQKPDSGDIAFYRPFLLQEVKQIGPRLLVALGATAAQSLLGRKVPVLKARGEVLPGPAGRDVFLTVHPSFLLRIPDPGRKRDEYLAFVSDLREAAQRAGVTP